MEISFDPAKRAPYLAERGLDFADAGQVFAGLTFTRPDERTAYPEPRFQTYGLLGDRLIIVVWAEAASEASEASDGRRIISMRKRDERERQLFGEQLG